MLETQYIFSHLYSDIIPHFLLRDEAYTLRCDWYKFMSLTRGYNKPEWAINQSPVMKAGFIRIQVEKYNKKFFMKLDRGRKEEKKQCGICKLLSVFCFRTDMFYGMNEWLAFSIICSLSRRFGLEVQSDTYSINSKLGYTYIHNTIRGFFFLLFFKSFTLQLWEFYYNSTVMSLETWQDWVRYCFKFDSKLQCAILVFINRQLIPLKEESVFTGYGHFMALWSI